MLELIKQWRQKEIHDLTIKLSRMKQNKQPNLFKPLAFYHPEPDNSGFAASFSYNSTEEKLYLNILRQTSWDTETNRGVFSGEDKKVVKFSKVEAADIAETIQNRSSFKAVHQFNGITNEINFHPSLELLESRFSLILTQNSGSLIENFKTHLSNGETFLLKLYIQAALQHSFYQN